MKDVETLNRSTKEDFVDKVVIKQKPEESEWVNHVTIWKKHPGIGISKCKGPEVNMFGKFDEQKDHQSCRGENKEVIKNEIRE